MADLKSAIKRKKNPTNIATGVKVDCIQDAAAQSMHVAVRIRPLSSREEAQGFTSCCSVINHNVVAIRKDGLAGMYLRSQQGSLNEYQYDVAFDQDATQQEVYNLTAKQFIPNVVDGFNVTVFAYGATGAGKTHTMMGNTRQDESKINNPDAGIIPNALMDIFEIIEAKKASCKFGEIYNVIMSFMEVYNEQVYDLLEPSGKTLSVREDQEKGVVVVAGITERVVTNPVMVLDLLKEGNTHRKTEATMANQVSSRSHAVLQLTVKHITRTDGGSELMTESKLSLIDLAGSERASATNNRGARLVEGANINKSLLALANCINALSENSTNNKRNNVKYRDSKLTFLLKSSLEGKCKLIMIANINPCNHTFEDSHNTLKYSNRAKNIKIHAHACDAVTKESTWMEREMRLKEENNMLRDRIAELENIIEVMTANGHHVPLLAPSCDMDSEEEEVGISHLCNHTNKMNKRYSMVQGSTDSYSQFNTSCDDISYNSRQLADECYHEDECHSSSRQTHSFATISSSEESTSNRSSDMSLTNRVSLESRRPSNAAPPTTTSTVLINSNALREIHQPDNIYIDKAPRMCTSPCQEMGVAKSKKHMRQQAENENTNYHQNNSNNCSNPVVEDKVDRLEILHQQMMESLMQNKDFIFRPSDESCSSTSPFAPEMNVRDTDGKNVYSASNCLHVRHGAVVIPHMPMDYSKQQYRPNVQQSALATNEEDCHTFQIPLEKNEFIKKKRVLQVVDTNTVHAAPSVTTRLSKIAACQDDQLPLVKKMKLQLPINLIPEQHDVENAPRKEIPASNSRRKSLIPMQTSSRSQQGAVGESMPHHPHSSSTSSTSVKNSSTAAVGNNNTFTTSSTSSNSSKLSKVLASVNSAITIFSDSTVKPSFNEDVNLPSDNAGNCMGTGSTGSTGSNSIQLRRSTRRNSVAPTNGLRSMRG